jgi:hypothetical protein
MLAGQVLYLFISASTVCWPQNISLSQYERSHLVRYGKQTGLLFGQQMPYESLGSVDTEMGLTNMIHIELFWP